MDGYLYRVNCADGNPRDGHARKDVTADLESTHRQGCVENGTSRWAELGEANERGHEESAEGSDEEELDECESYGVSKAIHDGLSGVGRHGGGCIPDATLEDEFEGCGGRNGREG